MKSINDYNASTRHFELKLPLFRKDRLKCKSYQDALYVVYDNVVMATVDLNKDLVVDKLINDLLEIKREIREDVERV